MARARKEFENMVLSGPGQAEYEQMLFASERSKKFPRVPEGTGKLEGQVAIVTGGAGGQGEIEAKIIAQQGAKVVVIDLNVKEINRVVSNIKADGGEAMGIVKNIAYEESWKEIVKDTVEAYGRIDILVNNAGIIHSGSVLNESMEDFIKLMEVDAYGVLLGMKHCAPEMTKVGGGAIVNTSSVYGAHFGPENCIAYATAKAAVVGMSRAAASDLAEYNIRVNTIHPGHILTPMTYTRPPNREKLAAAALMKRYGLSEEMAAPVLFLVSDDSSFITGQELYVDGGMTIKLNTANQTL